VPVNALFSYHSVAWFLSSRPDSLSCFLYITDYCNEPNVLSGCACLSVPTWSGTVLSVSWTSPRRGCWLPSETSIHIDGSAARSTHETLDSWWPSFPSCRCSRLEKSTTQCHFSALSVYFQKETQNRTFSRRFLPWLFTCVCMYYFTCLSFMFIFFLSACAAHRIVPASFPCS